MAWPCREGAAADHRSGRRRYRAAVAIVADLARDKSSTLGPDVTKPDPMDNEYEWDYGAIWLKVKVWAIIASVFLLGPYAIGTGWQDRNGWLMFLGLALFAGPIIYIVTIEVRATLAKARDEGSVTHGA